MDDLLEALTIFRKYLPEPLPVHPTNCCHDELWIMDVDPVTVEPKDHDRLEVLGFRVVDGAYCSTRFGSA